MSHYKNNKLYRKVLSNLFGKTCEMLFKSDHKHVAKRDKRRMSEESGK